ncbi:UNVERIFIED_CONTAM: Elongation of very long chain fatty acids protein 4 [Trichonephila clavipes]
MDENRTTQKVFNAQPIGSRRKDRPNFRWIGKDLLVLPTKNRRILKERGGVGWLILFEKFFSLLDTIFFVLRKKYSHISFLHVFHHVCMCLLSAWIINAASPGIFVYVSMTINCFVHVIMYFYYGLAAFGKRMKKYLWWKRYLTVMQILQFVIILGYMAFAFLTGCESFAIKSRLDTT